MPRGVNPIYTKFGQNYNPSATAVYDAICANNIFIAGGPLSAGVSANVNRILAGTAISVTPSAGIGNVVVTNVGVQQIVGGISTSIPAAGTGIITISTTSAGGGGAGSITGGFNLASNEGIGIYSNTGNANLNFFALTGLNGLKAQYVSTSAISVAMTGDTNTTLSGAAGVTISSDPATKIIRIKIIGTTGLVPYIGATANVNLGTWSLTANNLTLSTTTLSQSLIYTLSSSYTFAAATLTAILQAPSKWNGGMFNIKSISAGAWVTVSASQGTIDGQTTQVITQQYVSLQVLSNGTNWYII